MVISPNDGVVSRSQDTRSIKRIRGGVLRKQAGGRRIAPNRRRATGEARVHSALLASIVFFGFSSQDPLELNVRVGQGPTRPGYIGFLRARLQPFRCNRTEGTDACITTNKSELIRHRNVRLSFTTLAKLSNPSYVVPSRRRLSHGDRLVPHDVQGRRAKKMAVWPLEPWSIARPLVLGHQAIRQLHAGAIGGGRTFPAPIRESHSLFVQRDRRTQG